MKAFLCLLLTMLLATLAYAQDSVIVKQITIEPHIGVGFNGNVSTLETGVNLRLKNNFFVRGLYQFNINKPDVEGPSPEDVHWLSRSNFKLEAGVAIRNMIVLSAGLGIHSVKDWNGPKRMVSPSVTLGYKFCLKKNRLCLFPNITTNSYFVYTYWTTPSGNGSGSGAPITNGVQHKYNWRVAERSSAVPYQRFAVLLNLSLLYQW